MTGMTAKQLRDCVQRDERFNDGLRLEMGSGVVLQYFPGSNTSLQEIYIEGRRNHYNGLWDLDFFIGDGEVNNFFEVMGGIVHVLEILE